MHISYCVPLFRFAIAALGVAVVSTVDAAPPVIYSLSTLQPSPNGGESYGSAINASGQVAGASYSATGDGRAFRYIGAPGSGGVMQDLGALWSGSSGIAINASGQVAGHTYTFSSINGYAFRYDGTPGSGGTMYDLGTLAPPSGISYAQAYGINASGQVVGYSDINTTSSSPTHAFRTTGTPGVAGYVMKDLGTLGGANSYAFGINDSGQVAGSSYKVGDTVERAFRTTGTPGVAGYVMQDLGTLGGANSGAEAINASGQVAGSSQTTGNLTNHAFRTTGTPGVAGYVMRDMGSLGGSYISAIGINTAGQVVGYGYLPGDAAQHAFIHLGTPTASMIDLDAWLDANNPTEGTKWTLTSAGGLNDSLFVVGTGQYDANADGIYDPATDGTRAYILDASSLVPEPASLALLAVGGLALLRWPRRRAVAAGLSTGKAAPAAPAARSAPLAAVATFSTTRFDSASVSDETNEPSLL